MARISENKPVNAMKKLILSATAAMTMYAAQAQITIAPEAGLNLANASISTNSPIGDPGTSMIAGLKAGAVAEIPVVAGFFVQPGVFFSMKGARSTQSASLLGIPVKQKLKINLSYFEVPLNLGYRYVAGNAGSLFVTAGPYLGYALSGTWKTETSASTGTITTKDNIKFGSDKGEMKRLDVGLNFSAGYQLPVGLYLRVQYGLGLTNLYHTSNGTYKNNVLAFSLGYAIPIGK